MSSYDSSGRAKHSTKSQKSQQEILAAETNLRETRGSSITVPSDACNATGDIETVGTGRESLPHRATGSSSVSTRSGKNSDVNVGGNRMPDHSKDNSIRFLSVEGTVTRSSAATRNVSVVDRLSSTAAVTRQSSAAPSSSEAVAFQQAADNSVGVTSTATASMVVMTSGKKMVSNRSNAASARTRSVTQSRQTATSIQTPSSEAAASSPVSNAADNIVVTASMDVMTSGKTTMAIGSNAASSRTRSVTFGKQTPAATVTASAAAASNTQLR